MRHVARSTARNRAAQSVTPPQQIDPTPAMVLGVFGNTVRAGEGGRAVEGEDGDRNAPKPPQRIPTRSSLRVPSL